MRLRIRRNPTPTASRALRRTDAAEVGSGTQPVAVHAELPASAPPPIPLPPHRQKRSRTVHGADATFTTPAAPRLSVTVEPRRRIRPPGLKPTSRSSSKHRRRRNLRPAQGQEVLPPALTASKSDFYFIGISHGSGSTPNTNLAGLCPSALANAASLGLLTGLASRPQAGRKTRHDRGLVRSRQASKATRRFRRSLRRRRSPRRSLRHDRGRAEPAFGHLGFAASITNRGYRRTPTPRPAATPTNSPPNSTSPPSPHQSEIRRKRLRTPAPCPLYDPKNITSDLPPGLIANPQAVPHCHLAALLRRGMPTPQGRRRHRRLRP